MALVGNGFVRPHEFWSLQPQEVFWILEAKRQQQEKQKYGELSEFDVAELYHKEYGS